MVLKNSTIEKLAAEGKITYISAEESYQIYKKKYEKMTHYIRDYAKKTKASYDAARRLILTS